MQKNVEFRTWHQWVGRNTAAWLGCLASCLIAVVTGQSARADQPADQASIRILAPSSGLILEAPGKVVFEAQAVDPAGDIRHLEFFANDLPIGVSDYLLKIATIPGRPIPHRLEWNDIAAGVYRVVARGTDTQGNPVESDPVEILVRPIAPQGFALVKWGTDWKYSNDGTDQGDVWRSTTFDDSKWFSGPAPLGYGDGDEKTLTRKGEPPHPLTAYFRQTFQVPADLAAKSLLIRLVRDDGVVVYLNGQEVLRDNVPKGPITFSTVASESTGNENGVRTFVVPASALSAGANVVAAEVHQASATSSDLSFDLELTAIDVGGIPIETSVVSLEATWPMTGEPSPLARIAPGRVKVSRTGDALLPVVVALTYDGTATPGVDYAQPPRFVTIPAGKADTEFFIQAIEDGKIEGTESVIVMLREDPSAAPLLRYRIDPEHAKVEVQIHDADRVDKPTIVVQQPRNGDVFPLGAVIPIEATAIAPDGYINRVEFFDGDVRIGVSEILFIVAPPDGSPIQHRLEWKGATAGDHKLTVRAGTEQNPVQSEPVVISVKSRDGSSLVITAPESGAMIPVGQPVEIQAVAIDSKGYISRVEFFDGDRSIGVSQLAFLVAPEPGTPIRHALTWTDATAGRHVLSARAVTTSGDKLESDPVPIAVEGNGSDQVVVAIEATDATASEPTANAEADPGVFTLSRVAGPKDVEVVVNLRIGGAARSGIDYAPLEEVVKMPAGVSSVELVVKPLADASREGSEEVIVEILPAICILIFPPPPECYRIDGRGVARVVIRDDATDLQNRQPKVAITEPKSGAVYSSGETLVIRAEASDADGKIAKLELFDGDNVIGSTADSMLKVEWTAAEVGLHRLRAVATDDRGETGHSGAVVVFVRDLADQAFVKRQLPPAYLPGSAIEVHLLADPPRGGGAWTVEDAPPAGWVVSAISDEGAFDAVHGRVKFGPFTDGKSRDLHYQVTAAQGATGAQKFAGSSSFDGKSYPVVGNDSVLPAGENHPADSPSPNKSISADELTAYASAWLHGKAWGADGSSVPMSYVARAGFLWKSGEGYAFAPTKGGPPECWVPATVGGSSIAGAKGVSASGLVAGARRKSPADWKPGQAGRVEIELRPSTGTLAWAVEETVPAGWKVGSVSDDGVVDSQTGRIRWGLFYGATTRVLSYEVTPPADTACNGHFAGEVSYDGGLKPIDGVVLAGATDDHTRVRIIGSRRGADGKLHLDVEAAANQVFVVEGSSDLQAWEEVDAKVFTGEEIPVDDSRNGGSTQRYYRLRPVNR
ncbi:MAG: hypothetical protein IT581_18020 [Verrucomicrobiales bacterium]|nr:hypothetical protein [Verrucomicrobiales bacterium]